MKNLTDRICVAVASDDRYAPYMGVVLVSLLKNNPQEVFDIFIMNAGISVENMDKLNFLLKDFPNAFSHWITCDEALFTGLSGVKIDRQHSVAPYYRIFLFKFIPESYDKCLYFDCDTLILGGIRSLWETDLENYALAAVQDPGWHDRAPKLGIPVSEKYFNSGVLLINLKLWRKESFAWDVVDFIRKNPSKIEGWDQDGLNAVLYDRWKSLNERWNKIVFTVYGYGRRLKKPLKGLDLIRGPKIMHYASKHKPWLEEDKDPLRFIYFKYLSLTPWKDLVPPYKFYEFLPRYLMPLGSYMVYLWMKKRIRKLVRKHE